MSEVLSQYSNQTWVRLELQLGACEARHTMQPQAPWGHRRRWDVPIPNGRNGKEKELHVPGNPKLSKTNPTGAWSLRIPIWFTASLVDLPARLPSEATCLLEQRVWPSWSLNHLKVLHLLLWKIVHICSQIALWSCPVGSKKSYSHPSFHPTCSVPACSKWQCPYTPGSCGDG